VELTFETWPIDRCIDYARNPRKNDHAVDKVAAAIREFGFRVPIVAKSDGLVVDGHLRLKAAKKLGLTEVPVILADDMSEAQIKAFRLSVNKVAELAEWDTDLLGLEIADLKEMGFDLELTGFEAAEIDALFPDEPSAGLTDEDAVPEAPEQPVTVEADVWMLGRHRLMCGDSTSIDAVERLMDGRKADMVFTDPPYALFGNSTGAAVADDKMIRPFFRSIGASIYSSSKQGAHFYSCLDWKSWAAVLDGYNSAGLTVKNMIVWDKGSGALGAAYRSQHELIMFGSVGNSGISITKTAPSSKHKITDVNVWKCSRENKNGMHAALKPQELICRALENSSNGSDLVLDLFGGSGSTLIACEKTNRDCRMMELDPKYCDVIINRWQDFTGQQATLEATGQTYEELKEERQAA
jgi:DNA modification methylase